MTTATNLYDLASEYRLHLFLIEDQGGELTPESEAYLNALNASIEERIDACCSYDEELEATEAAMGAAIKRLQERKAGVTARRRRIKDHVRNCLERAGLSRVETTLFTARLQDSPPAAAWLGDPDAIPAEFQRVKTVVEFDKIAAVKAWKALGEDETLPPGIEVKRGKKTLVIK